MGYYWPEGMLLETEENKYYLQSEETLKSAMRIGQILEGRALLCDYDHNLVVDLYFQATASSRMHTGDISSMDIRA